MVLEGEGEAEVDKSYSREEVTDCLTLFITPTKCYPKYITVARRVDFKAI